MGQIKWVLINIDNTQIDYKKNRIIENGEMRRTINFLMDNDVQFTTVSGLHSSVISNYVRELYIPNKKSFLISSYGCEIYSLKKKRVIDRYIIDNKYIKDLDKILTRINFDFCKKIFVQINEKDGDVYFWNNQYKYFKKQVEMVMSERKINNGIIINNSYEAKNILNIVITFLENVDLLNLVKLLTVLNKNFSYRIIEDNKIIITSMEAGTGIAMDFINNKYYKLDKNSIMCFSDSINDVPIFKKSSISITIDSANEELKKIASNVFIGVENLYINSFLKKEISE